jgi:DNA polymerase III delta subunit
MPILILHGDHQANSRLRLGELIKAAKDQGRELRRLPASGLTVPSLEQVLGENTLFGSPQTIIIEELHSLPTSANKKALLELLAEPPLDPEMTELILWEKRALTKTMIGKFPGAQATEFKVSKSIFSWLDAVSGQKHTQKRQLELFHQALSQEDEWYCFIMLARQVRLLIQAQEGQIKGVAPFMVSKLKKQAATFSSEQLLRFHHRLLELDQKHKTSASGLTLTQDLDLLLLQL